MPVNKIYHIFIIEVYLNYMHSYSSAENSLSLYDDSPQCHYDKIYNHIHISSTSHDRHDSVQSLNHSSINKSIHNYPQNDVLCLDNYNTDNCIPAQY